MRRRAFRAASGAVCLGAALGLHIPAATAQSGPQRQTMGVKLEQLFRVESDDRVLIAPAHLVAADSLLYYMDSNRLVAWTYGGRVAWERGREGSGPGEHRLVTSQALDYATGDVWQYDLRNARIQIWDKAGRLRRAVTPAIPVLFRAVPLGGESVAGVQALGSSLFLKFSLNDPAHVDTVRAPLVDYSNPRFAFAASPSLLSCPGGQLVVAYAFDSRIIILRSATSTPTVRQAIDPVPVPAVVDVQFKEKGKPLTGYRRAPTAMEATLSSACDSERLYLLYAGTKGDAGRTIDVYRLSDSAYLGSFTLPEPVREIDVYQDRLVALRLEPIPAIVAWKVSWR